MNFNNPRQIVDKQYVDDIKYKAGQIYCPEGSMMWWPTTNAPIGWLRRDGAVYQISKLPKLYAVIGNMYGGSQASGTFAVPNDMADGLFIRSWNGTGTFAEKQDSAVPNINATFRGHNGGCSGAVWQAGGAGWHGHRNNDSNDRPLVFNASLCSSVYKDGVNEVRPANRCYLPIIKADDSYFNL